ncbi:hypothetical protein AB1Y20_002660 [Prymnesium parvum]|uniref:Uncharacterized protein n=1 Tax=Prymnesium parvum TaxID=97485 RepID=A0AB34JBT5_PRYPA
MSPIGARRKVEAVSEVATVDDEKLTSSDSTGEELGRVDERYLSFTIDLGQIAEPTRFWNPDGSGETIGRPTFDFANPRLRHMAAALAPAYLRIGGTEADRVIYSLEGTPPEQPPPPFKSVLTAAHVDALGEFALTTGLHVAFAVNAGWGARSAGGAWVSGMSRALMRYTARHGYPFTVWELGNEPNAWPLFQAQLLVQPEQYARDLRELAAARDAELPAARIAGPCTAYWPTIGEVPALQLRLPPRAVSNYLPRVLRAARAHVVPDVVTWHYYPGLSTRSALAKHRPLLSTVAIAVAVAVVTLCLTRKLLSLSLRTVFGLLGLVLAVASVAVAVNYIVRPVLANGPNSLRDPAVLDTAGHWAEQVRSEVMRLPKQPMLWLGETGSAQVGGEPGLSGRWATALWWLDQLGLLAQLGHAVQCRQTLSGADYGLIDDSTFVPTPDYWASVLWKRLMGTIVLRASLAGAPSTLRVYAHRGVSSTARTTFLLINLGNEEIRVNPPAYGAVDVWRLEGQRFDSPTCTINGRLATLNADGTVPELPPVREAHPTVAADSAMFVRV